MAETTFCGLDLTTLPGRVMIPRPASEHLVAAAVERIGARPARAADVGTGCGAIAVALAVAAPSVSVWATDVRPAAVTLATTNAVRHGVADRVYVRRGDLLAPVPGELDLVVANLPYLPLADSGRFPDLVQEPLAAVYADGDGLDPYRRLVVASEERLRDGGAVVLQLHRRVLVAERKELPDLFESLAALAAAA